MGGRSQEMRLWTLRSRGQPVQQGQVGLPLRRTWAASTPQDLNSPCSFPSWSQARGWPRGLKDQPGRAEEGEWDSGASGQRWGRMGLR